MVLRSWHPPGDRMGIPDRHPAGVSLRLRRIHRPAVPQLGDLAAVQGLSRRPDGGDWNARRADVRGLRKLALASHAREIWLQAGFRSAGCEGPGAVDQCYGAPGSLVTVVDRLLDARPSASISVRVSIELLA